MLSGKIREEINKLNVFVAQEKIFQETSRIEERQIRERNAARYMLKSSTLDSMLPEIEKQESMIEELLEVLKKRCKKQSDKYDYEFDYPLNLQDDLNLIEKVEKEIKLDSKN